MSPSKLPLLIAILSSLLAACATDAPEPMDPTGTWAMVLAWRAGSCGATGTTTQNVIVSRAGDNYAATTGAPHETTTGIVRSDNEMSTISITINNSDINNDGGSTHGVAAINATADELSNIVGSGSINVSGAVTCSQNFTLTGTLR